MSDRDPDLIEVKIIVDDETIERGDIYDIIEPTRWMVDIYQNEEIYNQGLKQFTESQKNVFAIFWYKYEVDNGGHSQFFYNSTGIIWKDALKGLEKLGLNENAEVLKSATRKLGGSPSLDRTLRNEQLNNGSVDFDREDNEFYEIDKTVNLEDRLIEYIQKNRKDFYFSGNIMKPRGY
jgi:hypothetical protein